MRVSLLALFACALLAGCSNPVTGPSCHRVTYPKVEERQWTQVNGRLVQILVIAPKTVVEECGDAP